MSGKNWCQNPECAGRETGRYHRITNTFRSKYATHDRPDSYWVIGEYFCSHTCTQNWLHNHLKMIFDRKILPPKVIQRISVPAEEYDSTKRVRVDSPSDSDGYYSSKWKDVPIKAHRVVGSDTT